MNKSKIASNRVSALLAVSSRDNDFAKSVGAAELALGLFVIWRRGLFTLQC